MLLQNDEQIACSYLLEQIESYVDNLHRLFPTGLNPSLIQKITKQNNELLKLSCLSEFKLKIKDAASELNQKYQPIKNALNGKIELADSSDVLYFPVLENDGSNIHLQSGFLETIKVEIKEAKAQINFYISPGGREIENLIQEQIEISWNLSIEHLKKYVKSFNLHHDVFIHFNKKLGYYTGNSLGAALSLVFLKELLSYYNAPVTFSFNGRVALTGGLDRDENILKVSEDILEKKVVTVFFSTVQTFIVADNEKQFASEKLNELKQEYPNRNLKIIGVEDLDDLLARRNVVNIRKQKIVVRSAKYVRQHWMNTLLSVVIALIIAYIFILDFDTNPATIEHAGKLRLIKNKNGKVLWQSKLSFEDNQLNYHFARISEKIFDVDGNGLNEVLLVNQDENLGHIGRLDCFNNDGVLLWKYEFDDSIETIYEKYSNKFTIRIAGIDNLDGKKVLYLFAQHNIYFPTAVFRLDAKTGKRLPGTFWHPGGLGAGILADLNGDGLNELYLTSINNEWESAVFFGLEKDSLYGRGPAFGKYVYPNREISNFLCYLSIPKSDYSKYKNVRYPLTGTGGLFYLEHENLLTYPIIYGEHTELMSVSFRINQKYEIEKLIILDQFRVKRDSLVAQGKLSLPLTDTKDYVEILKDQVRYWDGEKFITAEEYFGYN